MVIRLDIEIWETGKGALKEAQEKVWVSGGSCMGTVGFCGPCACLNVFLL
jgi:hypothetical protein